MFTTTTQKQLVLHNGQLESNTLKDCRCFSRNFHMLLNQSPMVLFLPQWGFIWSRSGWVEVAVKWLTSKIFFFFLFLQFYVLLTCSTKRHSSDCIELDLATRPLWTHYAPQSTGKEGSYGSHWSDWSRRPRGTGLLLKSETREYLDYRRYLRTSFCIIMPYN